MKKKTSVRGKGFSVTPNAGDWKILEEIGAEEIKESGSMSNIVMFRKAIRALREKQLARTKKK